MHAGFLCRKLKLQIMIDKEVKDLESDLELAQEGTGLEESDVGMETATEDRESGTVSYKTYLKYFTTGNAIIFLVFVAIAFVLPDSKLCIHSLFSNGKN